MDYLLNGLPYFPGTTVFGTGLFADGTAAAPSVSFTNDPDTGLYRIGPNNIGVAANGAKVLDIATTGLGITGTATISSTTAGSSGAGALVVTGGLATGDASYIGGTITAVGTGTHTFGTTNTVTMAAGTMTLQGATAVASGRLKLQSSNTDYGNGVTLLYSSVSPDASARAWQIASNFIANGNLDFLVSASNSTQATGAAISFTSAGGINAAGAVAIGNTVGVGVAVASTHKVTMVIGGVTYYLLASNV